VKVPPGPPGRWFPDDMTTPQPEEPRPSLDTAWYWIKFLGIYDAVFLVLSLWIFESLVIE